MNFTLCNENKIFPFLIIDDFYDSQEEKQIWTELELLHPLLKDEDGKTGNIAVDLDGNKKGEASRLYLDDFDKDNREQSSILNLYKKIVSDDVIGLYEKIVPSWVTFKASNTDVSQISYYENKGYYGEHFDLYMHTCLIWFYEKPKKFQGGDLKFTQSSTLVECKHNRMVLFPSYYLHEVININMEKMYTNKGLGRYCLTHFYNKR